ncbi:BREX-2 system adenine-specific DNA-methyltransferase PglX [Georgenia subflava]|uniref:site-specific DNA-methyltransferase (adenine-specific) n=1 Tax=Georgenia subflava TaxID=1622177 RepID=A0A6N7EK52_9MICO|nr:BREX-2 system adenine-specific DNA-methyltransferase PglX [Georgenia subflava]MPV35654.1 BREX-2 system adenine-specific DNA-methyltransferase PglX [Georgenia subflava]
MIDSARLLTDLRRQLTLLTRDLKAQAEDPSLHWSQDLRRQHREATERERTALTWPEWRDGEVDQAAVAWIVATAFIRFCEDNALLDGARDAGGNVVALPWIGGPTAGPRGDRLARAAENETVFYRHHPAANPRDWLYEAFGLLASLPAGRLLVDREHNPVWRAPISSEAAQALLDFWRRRDDDGALVHDFTDEGLGTRFLGDLYQDLSEFAKKKYALLQTPEFVEEFVLDRTLEPAVAEFGLTDLKLIDPTCGSGHFLLGAFARLVGKWREEAPGADDRDFVQRALDSIHGVDVNPFAVAIARFRLTVAALHAAGDTSLVGAPDYDYHLAIGDSLLAAQGRQDALALDGDEEPFSYAAEDVGEYRDILDEGRYHVVVGNPPYITVKDKALNDAYRAAYSTCHRQYALSVPFMELFFRLARRYSAVGGAGYVGQITSNSFMKREFGTKVVEDLLSGHDVSNPVDLQEVIDTSGAYIPGHGTPTVILVGRRQLPSVPNVRAVLGVRGEPGQPADPANGKVWREIVDHLDQPEGFDGRFVTVAELSRDVLSRHPWSLVGGTAGALQKGLEGGAPRRLSAVLDRPVGGAIRAGADEIYMRPRRLSGERSVADLSREFVVGDGIRDYQNRSTERILFPYTEDLRPTERLDGVLWPWRTVLARRATFQGNMADAGLRWSEYMQFTPWSVLAPRSITFAFVATHNHFVLDRGGKVFKQSAPVIKLRAGASEDEHLDLLGVLNSSTACFWLKQVSYEKGAGSHGLGIADELWEWRYEFAGTKLQEFPLPATFPRERARALDTLAQELAAASPGNLVAHVLENEGDVEGRVRAAREDWELLRRRMIFDQEELDWEVYRLYGLIDEDVTYHGGALDEIDLGERAFEVALARAVASGAEETAWFERHGSTPVTELRSVWPADYRAVVERRLALTESNSKVRLLERPENKRRWATDRWDAQLRDALRAAVLDRLEEPALWRDAAGPVVRSVAQIADLVRDDASVRAALRLLTGAEDADAVTTLTALLKDEAVPFLAAHRYTTSGLEKHAEWRKVWDLQRREDAGERVTIPVPPKYRTPDFRTTAIWRARGKLDVPKERLTSYPGVRVGDDATPVLGWAGWDHADQAVAIARLIGTLASDDPNRTALVAGLVELEPWLHQWHSDPDPRLGTSAAASISAMIDDELAHLGATRDDVAAWRPDPPARGRRRTVRA